MKKMAIWALAAFAMFAVSCDKNNIGGEGDVTLTASALVGTWTISGLNFSETWVFTSEKLTKETGWDKTEGTYTVKNGTIAYNITKAWDKDGNTWQERNLGDNEKTPIYVQGKIIYSGSVLVINFVISEGSLAPHHNTEDTSFVLFKSGGSISSDTAPLQGTWHWYMFGTNKTETRIRIIFEGSSYELIIQPWSEKYVGSYTYQNGYITCTVDNSYSARNPETLKGEVNPVTLEATWHLFENVAFPTGLTFPFVADGDVAYGIVANFPSKYYKK